MNYQIYFLLFFIYSFIGWLMEVLVNLINKKKLINRGFFIGPYCPIYGIGSLLIITLLNKYMSDPLVLFLMSIVICSALEYTISFIMEKLFNARWWDYSNKKFNINGRICLETMIPFGLLGTTMMYVINKEIQKILLSINPTILNITCVILLITFLTDVIISLNLIGKVNLKKFNITDDITEEVTAQIREIIFQSRFGKRLLKAFPNMIIVPKKRKKQTKQ